MKKFILCVCFFLVFCFNSYAADVCGNTYTFFYDDIVYLVKFTSANPELPCTSGTAVLYWQNQTKTFNFTVNSQKLVNVPGLGKLFLSSDQLYLLDSTSIVFNQL